MICEIAIPETCSGKLCAHKFDTLVPMLKWYSTTDRSDVDKGTKIYFSGCNVKFFPFDYSLDLIEKILGNVQHILNLPFCVYGVLKSLSQENFCNYFWGH